MESALGFVVRKIVQQIQNETVVVCNFKQDFQWLNMRLTMLTATLKYADQNGTDNAAIQQWIEDVRNILWDVEDILDEYSLHQHIPGVGDKLYCWSHPQLVLFRYKMGRKIRTIKERMKSILETANELKLIREVASFETATSTSAVQPEGKRKNLSMIEPDSLPVTLDIKVHHIIERLDDPAVQVLAVVGLGGIGKTFLLQHVYNKVKHLFDESVWLSVSNTYSLVQLQRDLAFKLKLNDLARSGVDFPMAAETIHDHLKKKKCLIVLDDVWRATQEEDLVRRLGIPIAVNKSCKVIVTSRNTEVFSHLHPFIYRMPLLSADDSWKLFCAHAFPYSHENSRPAQLEMLARQIEKECGGLPLAIKTMASCLAEAKTSTVWESKLHQLKEVRLGSPHDPILQILRLSYYWLPSFLKPCFVYLSFFAEDEEIDCEYLVNLWIAEGFIPQTGDQVGMAWGYLRQLATLCLVHISESRVDPYFTGVRDHSCTVHDLVLELAVCISKENKSAFSVEEVSRKATKSGCRRILLAKKGIDDKAIAESNLCCPKVVRTLSLSKNSILNNGILINARVLRVLDLSQTGISTLPECIRNLKLLRLLNLSSTKLKEVPQCVRKLKSLSFFDVSWCKDLSRLPLWIGDLVSLQHVNIEGCSSEILRHIPKGVSKLMSLRTLRSRHTLELSVEDDEYLRLEDVGNMTCLEELRIKVQHEAQIRSLAQGTLGRLVNVRRLKLFCDMQGFARIPLPETIKAMKDLQKLFLNGNFAVPGWIRSFENLRILHLKNGYDYSDLYPALETMGNLSLLMLGNDENCREFPKTFGKRGGFPNLCVFEIYNFEALEELPEMEDGAMAHLELLVVMYCPRLKNVPQGFQRLRRLRQFVFIESGTDEYRSRLKEEWITIQANNQQLRIEIA